jgi:hypothetical protein
MSEYSRAERVAEVQRELSDKVLELVSEPGWQQMLDMAARFTKYSANNLLLIMVQRPTATRVAGFTTWKSAGRHVRQGERGIRILAPAKYKVTDDTTGDEHWALRGFCVAHVFDVLQTDGEPLPDLSPRLLHGSGFAGLFAGITAQIVAGGFVFERGDCGAANGWTNWDTRTVRVRADVSDAQAIKTALHELAHVMMHDPVAIDYRLDRARCELEAESLAYIVCRHAGLLSDDYSVPYLAHWAGGNVELVKATADRVVKSAHTVIARLEDTERVEFVRSAA